jgi:hypothetical protein
MKKLMTILTAGVIAASCTAASAVELGGVDIHGFASQGFLKGTRENDFVSSNSGKGSFNFNEYGVNFSKQILPELRLGVQFFAQDRGSYGKDKITLDWAYGDYRFQDWLGVRVGKIKNPLGLYGETRDTDSLRTFVLLPQPIYVDALRDTFIATNGIDLYGNVPLGPVGKLSYQALVGAVTPTTDEGSAMRVGSSFTSALSGTAGINSVKVTDISADTVYVQSLEWSPPLDGLRLAASRFQANLHGTAVTDAAATAPASLKNLQWDINMYTRYVMGAEYTWKDLVVAGEYDLTDLDQVALGKTTQSKSDSWYLSAAYRLTDWFEAGAYYTERYTDRDDRDGSKYAAANAAKGLPAHNRYHKDTALTLRFDPMQNVVVKVEGHLIDGTALLDASEFKTAGKESYLFATKVTVSF